MTTPQAHGLTRAEVETVKQEVILGIGDFDRPSEEIRNPLVAMLREMVVTDAALRAEIASFLAMKLEGSGYHCES